MASTGPAVVTSPTTVTSTTAVTGQGTQPILRVLLSTDPVTDTTPTWKDVTDDVRNEAGSDRGRDTPQQEFDAGTGSVTLDNRGRRYEPLYIANYCINPSFEVDLTGWFTNNGSSFSGSPTTSDFYVGSQCLQITTAASALSFVQLTSYPPAVLGQYWTGSAYVKGPAGVPIQVVISELNNLSAVLASGTSSTFTLTGGWDRVYLTYLTTNASTVKVRFDLQKTGDSSVRVILMDGVLFEQTSKLNPYIDGSFSPGAWTGFAFQSTTQIQVAPLNRLWLRAEFSGAIRDIIKGYVTSWAYDYPAPGTSNATATAAIQDEFLVLTQAGLPVTSPPRESYATLIDTDNPDGYWEMSEDPAGRTRLAIDPNLMPLPREAGVLLQATVAQNRRGDLRRSPRKRARKG